jgi:LCP family protein required for cell wall assembly
LNSQFKNPLGGKSQPVPQNDAWLTGGTRPAAPSDQTQGRFSPNGQIAPQFGTSLATPPRGGQAPQVYTPASLTEQPTIKQPSFTRPLNGAPPQTPDGYVQGQHGRYGPGQMSPVGVPNGPQGLSSPQMFAPPQQRPSMGSPLAAPSFNTLNQANSGSSFSRSGATMLAAPPVLAPAPLPGTFNPNRPPLGTSPLGPGGRRPDGPPGKNPSGKRKKKRRVPIWARVVIGFLSFLLVLGGGGFWYYQVNFANTLNNIVGQTAPRTKDDGADPNAALTNGIFTGPRVNILLLGSDTDQKFQNGYLAQTDIVVSIDPNSKTVGMLSIPRDFYLNVPGQGMHKLDEAYYLGGLQGGQIGGVELSRRTIEQDFGIAINYYAWVGLDGFIKVINTVNGVDVDVQHPIVDGNYPDDTGTNANDPNAFKRLYIPPGPQHLDGPTALEYVRSRHADLVGDFGRSVRQQQVLSALKTKLANPSIFGQLPQIAQDLNGFVKTDMKTADVLKLMNFARGINANQITRLTLGPPYSHSGTAPAGTPDAGASVVIPDCTKIVPAISQFLQMGSKAICNIGDTGDSSAVATTTPTNTNQPTPLTTPIDGNNVQDWGTMASNATTSLSNGPSDLFGVRSLLDLLVLGVFESPDAFQL